MAFLSSRDEFPKPPIPTVIPMTARGGPRDADINKAVADTEKALAQFVAPSTLEIGEQSAKRIRDAAERHACAIEERGQELVNVLEGMLAKAKEMLANAHTAADAERDTGNQLAAEIYRTAHETYEWDEMMKAMARKHESPPVDEQKAEQAAAGVADEVAEQRVT